MILGSSIISYITWTAQILFKIYCISISLEQLKSCLRFDSRKFNHITRTAQILFKIYCISCFLNRLHFVRILREKDDGIDCRSLEQLESCFKIYCVSRNYISLEQFNSCLRFIVFLGISIIYISKICVAESEFKSCLIIMFKIYCIFLDMSIISLEFDFIKDLCCRI